MYLKSQDTHKETDLKLIAHDFGNFEKLKQLKWKQTCPSTPQTLILCLATLKNLKQLKWKQTCPSAPQTLILGVHRCLIGQKQEAINSPMNAATTRMTQDELRFY